MASRAARSEQRIKPYRARQSLGDQEAMAAGIMPAGADGMPGMPTPGIGAMGGPMDVSLGPDAPLAPINGVLQTPTDDGGMVIDFNPTSAKAQAATDFDANLAEHMSEMDLNNLATQVIDGLEADLDSRADWDSAMAEGVRQLGIKIEDREWPFPGSSGVYDTLMMEAVSRDHSMTVAELLPASGPVKTQIIGQSDEKIEQQASRVQAFFNYYLTEGAPEYYDDRDQMFFWRALVGSVFTKTYMDPILGRPVSPFITPENFVVSFTTSHLDTSPRYTHIIPMNEREMRLRQLSGFYRDIDLQDPSPESIQEASDTPISNAVRNAEGRKPIMAEGDIQYRILEQHVDLDLEGFEHKDKNGEITGLPLPYIITVDEESRRVLAIRRNWKKSDPTCRKIQYFVHYKFMPGLGFYGYGYAHILGNSTYAASSLKRQIIDAATLNMFPGGLTNAQMKTGDNNLNIGPCEFRYVETAGMPIQNAIMPMPYKEPSQVTLALLQSIREDSKNLANAQEIAVGEGRQDAPVGTTVALMEAATRQQSANIKRAHRSMRKEFRLFAALFAEFLPEAPYPYPTSGMPQALMKTDFSNRIDIIPVSDPNITSSAQRMVRAEAYLRLGAQAPDIYDKYALNRNMLVEMGLDNAKIDRLLPPKPQAIPMDPVSENQNCLLGKPLKAADYQDHDSHIAVHTVFQQVPAMQSHIAEHVGMKMRQKIQLHLGKPLPPLGQQLPPQIENQIAMMAAQAMQQITQPQGQQPTPEQIAMQQIAVEGQKVMADIDKSKREQETASYVANLRLAAEREKIAEQARQADMKAEAESAKAIHPLIKHGLDHMKMSEGARQADNNIALEHFKVTQAPKGPTK